VALRIPEDRFRQLVRKGMASPAYRLARYTSARRRATLVALLIDLETRLTNAMLDMAVVRRDRRGRRDAGRQRAR